MDELQDLKKKHGEVYTLSVKNKEGKVITIYLREIDRIVFKSVSALIQKDELTGIESMLRSLWIGGDSVDKIIDDFKALRNAGATLMPMLETEAGELKKN